MPLPEVFESLKKYPGMWLPDLTFNSLVGFVDGYDVGTQGGLLAGYREFLVVFAGGGDNFVWWGLIRHIAFKRGIAMTDEAALSALFFETFEAFLDVQRQHRGLQTIFSRYESWLKSRSRSLTPTRKRSRPKKR